MEVNKEANYNKEKENKDLAANLFLIKSFKNIKDIFSFLSKKKKLYMIIYSKKAQKKFLIDIETYKNESGRYFIGEKNGEGKEYKLKTNVLIFEGNYKKGKKNGKGKEYYDTGELKFIGDYLKGERNGKGKEYYNNNELFELESDKEKDYKINESILKFEGEYLNGLRNGKGKEYNCQNRLIFEGNYLNGERCGTGREYNYYYGSSFSFEGEYLNGKRNGKGKEFLQNELMFEGEYLNGEKNGKGKEYISELVLSYIKRMINNKKTRKLRKTYIVLMCEYFNKKNDEKGDGNNYNKYLISESQYLKGEKYGKVKNYFKGKLLFEK